MFGVSQSTASRAITRLTPILATILSDQIPVAEDLDSAEQYIVDGSLLPCWSWADHPELYSGKHKTTGLDVQVACTLSGHLAWVSDPANGSTHDITTLRASGVFDTDFAGRWAADKGYLGSDTHPPDPRGTPPRHGPVGGRPLGRGRSDDDGLQRSTGR